MKAGAGAAGLAVMVRMAAFTARPALWAAALLLALAGAALRPGVPAAEPQAPLKAMPAPEFTHTAPQDWLQSPPLRLADLRGHAVLLDVWTFDCWNCYRSFPWLNALEARLGPQGLRVIGIHSPEFERERDPAAVTRKMAEFGLKHPVMLDNDFSYWRALGNRYWPAWYLLDKQGRIRAHHVGETPAGDARAQRIEEELRALLAERLDDPGH
jgi:thiol-disulfide isomerase/thioredoxin